jgi:hypothetical protein
MVDRMLGSWYVDCRYGFLLRLLGRVGLPDLEFDGVSATVMVSPLASHLEGPQIHKATYQRWSRVELGCEGDPSFFFHLVLCAKANILLFAQFCQVGMYVACTIFLMI